MAYTGRTEFVGAHVEPEVKLTLQKMSKRDKRSVSSIVSDALKYYLDVTEEPLVSLEPPEGSVPLPLDNAKTNI